MADGSVLNSYIKKGFLDATCNGKLLPKIEALHVPDLAATLVSSLQIVSEGVCVWFVCVHACMCVCMYA